MRLKPTTTPITAIIIGLAITAAACGDSTGTTAPATSALATTSPVTTSPVTTSPVTTSPTSTPAILDWEATLIGGGTISGADLAGQDTLFWFWAPT